MNEVSQYMENLRSQLDAQRLRADTAEAERDSWKDMREQSRARNAKLRKKLTATEQRIAELEKDAARYRYLRDPDNRDGLEPEDVIVVGIAEGEDIAWLEQMDQAIDVMLESAALSPKPEADRHET